MPGPGKPIKSAINNASNSDTVLIHSGIYREGNIVINKSITLIGLDYPVLDGEFKNESELINYEFDHR